MPSALFVTTVPITLEAFLLPFADHFRGQGWRVDALSNGATSAPIADHFDDRFDVAWSRNPFSASNLLGTSSKVRRIVEENRYDIVHVHTPIASFVTRYALRTLPQATRPRVIYTAHGFHFYEDQGGAAHAFFRRMERTAGPWTDYLVTINREDYEAAEQLGTIDPKRVRYIPGIGVDTVRFSPTAVSAEEAARVRDELGAAPDQFAITMIAEFSPVKRHSFALDTISAVSDERVRLILVGDGPTEVQVREQIERLGLQDRVRVAGYRRDVPAVLLACDALLLVSEREGLNRSVLEAMSCARPVFGTATRGIADAVGTDAGWIVGKNDAQALAAAIDAAVADPSEVARRGLVARQRVCMEFALERILAAYDGLYHEALASRL
jgi:glycosyltransferase involved in cell wall biosynthesis